MAITLVSSTASGQQGSGASTAPVFSPDGSRLAFTSLAANFSQGDTNGLADLFVKTLATGAIEQASADAARGQNRFAVEHASFSADGSRLVFVANFAPVTGPQIYLREVGRTGLQLLSQDSDGFAGNFGARDPSLSPDGRLLAFVSGSTNFVPGEQNGGNRANLYLKNLQTGAFTRVFPNAGVNDSFSQPVFSPDGGKLAFISTGLLAAGANRLGSVYVLDLASGVVTLASTAVSGPANGPSFSPGFSADGTRIVFTSNASNLFVGDTNSDSDVFVKDLVIGTLTRASTGAAGAAAGGGGAGGVLSPDGTLVAFSSGAADLSPGDTNARFDVFVKNLRTGAVTLVTAGLSGQSNGASGGPVFSPDGLSVAFSSQATNLVAGDTNGVGDVFIASVASAYDEVLTGDAGANVLSGGYGADVLSGGFGADILYGNQDADVLYGNQDNDVLYGGQGNDAVYGGQDDDVAYGNLGDDLLFGNLGNDVLNGGAGTNLLDGADGIDTANYADALSGVTVSLAITTAQATGVSADTLVAIENLTGSAFADLLTGDAAVNVISGGFGADVVYGGLGTDVLYGNQDGDILYGNQDADLLYGGQGDDALFGGQGDDVITGGIGADVLQGNLGADTFLYLTVNDSPLTAFDQITEFTSGQDRIDLRAVHTAANDTFVLSPASGFTMLDVDLGGDGGVDLRIVITGTVAPSDVIWS